MHLIVMSDQVIEFHTDNVKQDHKFNKADHKFTFKEILYKN